MLVWAVGALAEGLGIRAVARVFEVDPNAVLAAPGWQINTAFIELANLAIRQYVAIKVGSCPILVMQDS
jgi:hypothetical protein